MNRFVAGGALAVLLLVLGACASTRQSGEQKTAAVAERTPQWISMPSAVFPADTYLAQTGTAADKDSAELQAVQRVAALFGQQVDSTTVASKRMEQAQQAGKVATASASGFNQKILQTVAQDRLIGIQLAETWYDKAHATWYAVAVLNRPQTAHMYGAMLDTNNATVAALCKTAAPATLYAYTNVDFAVDIAQLNKGYLERLFVLDASLAQQKAAETRTPESLRGMAHLIAAEIPVHVAIAGDKDRRIATAFEKALSDLGFNSTATETAPYVLVGSLKLTPSQTTAKDVFYTEYLLQCNLRDVASGQNVVTWSASGRDGSVTAEKSESRTLTTAAKKITAEYSDALRQSLKQTTSP